jgi:hypothetical protein
MATEASRLPERRRSDELHFAFLEELRIGVELRIRSDTLEILFHFPRRTEGNQHASRSCTDGRKRVRDAARSQHGFARTQIYSLLTHLEYHFPFQHIEPFLLIEMQVKRRAAGLEMLVLNDKEAAVGVTARHFEKERGVVLPAKTRHLS